MRLGSSKKETRKLQLKDILSMVSVVHPLPALSLRSIRQERTYGTCGHSRLYSSSSREDFKGPSFHRRITSPEASRSFQNIVSLFVLFFPLGIWFMLRESLLQIVLCFIQVVFGFLCSAIGPPSKGIQDQSLCVIFLWRQQVRVLRSARDRDILQEEDVIGW